MLNSPACWVPGLDMVTIQAGGDGPLSQSTSTTIWHSRTKASGGAVLLRLYVELFLSSGAE